MQIFSGSSNLALAKNIVKKLNSTLGQIEISKFPNKEARIWIKTKVTKKVALVQSFSGNPDEMIIEFCLIMDALKRAGATQITAIIPWMGYCIQDKIFRKGEPLSSRVVANIINSTNPSKIITFDLHNEAIQGYFKTPLTHLSANSLLIKAVKKEELDCVVAPDVGALKETTKTAQALNLPIVVLNKKRDLNTGEVEIVNIAGDVKGKNALIMDDFISTGSTLIQTSKYLKSQKVNKIVVAITHHLFVPGVNCKLAKSSIDKLYITDTIAMPTSEKVPKLNLNIVSIANEIISNI